MIMETTVLYWGIYWDYIEVYIGIILRHILALC